jgi:DNA primase
MFERGFEPETLMEFDIGFDDISKRISIPARDEEGRLLGFKGRAWWDDARPKYLALGGEKHGFEPYEVSRVLWGLHVAKESGEGPLIVIEGELNALMMHQHGFPRTVGISGRRLSRIQVDLIKKYADSVIIYFDDLDDSLEAASKLVMDLNVMVVPEHDKDAADSTQEEVLDLLSSAEPAILHMRPGVGI